MKTYIYHTDPGHGWLQVSKDELLKVNANLSISSYSYQNKDYLYLEEDCDMQKAIETLNISESQIVNEHTDEDSKIRSYRRIEQ